MPRKVTFEFPSDTSLFSPIQAQPRALLALTMTGWARWIRAYLVSFPRLIRDHRVGVVALGVHIEYLERFDFFDADAISVEVTVRVHKGGAKLMLECDYHGAGRRFARSWLPMRTVILEEGSFTATPGLLPPCLLDKFDPDEIVDEAPPRIVPGLVKAVESGLLLAEGDRHFTIDRYRCEVADQWCYVEVPALAGSGRERLALMVGDRIAELREALGKPLRRIDTEYTHPFYAFESGTMSTQAHLAPNGLAFVHRLRSGAQVHATVVEQF